MAKMHVKKGDIVAVLTGKDKGKKGKVIRTFPKKSRIIVEGVNKIKRHTRPSQSNPQGGLVEKESAVHVSNVLVVCPSCGMSVRAGKREVVEGTWIRICKQCGGDLEKG